MIHETKERNEEFGVDVKVRRYILADDKGRRLVKHVELKDSTYIDPLESFSSFTVGRSRSAAWKPLSIVEYGSQAIVMFSNGRFVGIPLVRCRYIEYQTETKRDESAVNMAKARAAKAARKEMEIKRDLENE